LGTRRGEDGGDPGLGFLPTESDVRVGCQVLETLFDKCIFPIRQRSGIQPFGKEEREELQALRSQNAILKPGRGQHSKYPPCAFTEHGALMAANILNSPRAVAMSVYVIRAFGKMREDLAANAAILKRLAEIDKTLLLHDGALRDIYQKLRPQLEPPPPPSAMVTVCSACGSLWNGMHRSVAGAKATISQVPAGAYRISY
jgi:hypothetical protein